MGELFALIGIIIICFTTSACTIYALRLHDEREKVKLRILEYDTQHTAYIEQQMLEQHILPPARTRTYRQ